MKRDYHKYLLLAAALYVLRDLSKLFRSPNLMSSSDITFQRKRDRPLLEQQVNRIFNKQVIYLYSYKFLRINLLISWEKIFIIEIELPGSTIFKSPIKLSPSLPSNFFQSRIFRSYYLQSRIMINLVIIFRRSGCRCPPSTERGRTRWPLCCSLLGCGPPWQVSMWRFRSTTILPSPLQTPSLWRWWRKVELL